MTPVLALEGVERRYSRGGRLITSLDGVNLAVAVGETLGLVGPSGSGKSTLARVAMALEPPDAGCVRIDGIDLGSLAPAALRCLRARWTMVFQDPAAALNPRTTVGEAIAVPLRIHRTVPAARRPARIAALLETVGLDPALAARPIHAVSGGQRQRVAIARAIATGPALVVLDEAVSALDTVAREAILRLVVELQRRDGTAFLFISHDLAAVRAVAHRVAIIDSGRIVEEGPTAQVIAGPSTETGRALVGAVPALDQNAALAARDAP